MMLVLGSLMLLVQTIIGRPVAPQRVFEGAASSAWLKLVTFSIFGATVGPLTEELFFRGFVYNALRSRIGTFWGLIIQAGLFALIHPFAIAQRGVVFLIGIVLATVYDWRKTLLTPILMHCCFNVVGLTMGLVAVLNSPFLGVITLPHDQGCQITKVLAGSAAEKAGVRTQDIITVLDGQPVHTYEEVARTVSRHKEGDTVEIEILRDGHPMSIRAELGKRPEN
jgi:hypothetical protein